MNSNNNTVEEELRNFLLKSFNPEYPTNPLEETIQALNAHYLNKALEIIDKTNRFNHAGCSVNGKVHAEYCKDQTEIKDKLRKAFKDTLGEGEE